MKDDKSVKEYHRVHKLMFQQIPCIADFKEAKIKNVRVMNLQMVKVIPQLLLEIIITLLIHEDGMVGGG